MTSIGAGAYTADTAIAVPLLTRGAASNAFAMPLFSIRA